jgi:hypothetical protein
MRWQARGAGIPALFRREVSLRRCPRCGEGREDEWGALGPFHVAALGAWWVIQVVGVSARSGLLRLWDALLLGGLEVAILLASPLIAGLALWPVTVVRTACTGCRSLTWSEGGCVGDARRAPCLGDLAIFGVYTAANVWLWVSIVA